MTVIAILAFVALLLAVISFLPNAPQNVLIAVAVILLAVGLALPVLVR